MHMRAMFKAKIFDLNLARGQKVTLQMIKASDESRSSWYSPNTDSRYCMMKH